MIVGKLGSGGLGVVYDAVRFCDREQVAVKLVDSVTAQMVNFRGVF